MSDADRAAIDLMDLDSGMSGDVSAVSHTTAPGDEGLDMSHEGGEYEAYDGLIHEVAQSTGNQR